MRKLDSHKFPALQAPLSLPAWRKDHILDRWLSCRSPRFSEAPQFFDVDTSTINWSAYEEVALSSCDRKRDRLHEQHLALRPIFFGKQIEASASVLDSRERAVAHEAGHAVMFAALGIGCWKVCLHHSSQSWTGSAHPINDDVPYEPKTCHPFDHAIAALSAIAGPLAEYNFGPRAFIIGGNTHEIIEFWWRCTRVAIARQVATETVIQALLGQALYILERCSEVFKYLTHKLAKKINIELCSKDKFHNAVRSTFRID